MHLLRLSAKLLVYNYFPLQNSLNPQQQQLFSQLHEQCMAYVKQQQLAQATDTLPHPQHPEVTQDAPAPAESAAVATALAEDVLSQFGDVKKASSQQQNSAQTEEQPTVKVEDKDITFSDLWTAEIKAKVARDNPEPLADSRISLPRDLNVSSSAQQIVLSCRAYG